MTRAFMAFAISVGTCFERQNVVRLLSGETEQVLLELHLDPTTLAVASLVPEEVDVLVTSVASFLENFGSELEAVRHALDEARQDVALSEQIVNTGHEHDSADRHAALRQRLITAEFSFAQVMARARAAAVSRLGRERLQDLSDAAEHRRTALSPPLWLASGTERDRFRLERACLAVNYANRRGRPVDPEQAIAVARAESEPRVLAATIALRDDLAAIEAAWHAAIARVGPPR